ncbi:aldo/keto reductase [Xylanibacillus composti]|uniref:Oxidoreductase n=1 Tax=Xylanibacillus composti TaxID=1572762 RepID=A0A8J4H075_9BACL|nr:aldo/keto reductase [Xylanibacillus composti]MDT9726830.1 aldo/keto reductase [Xylanibacillus composti]GIQ67186.1 oxidoreductase [Xylanibacillus composti]
MEYVQLGKSDMKVSRITFGAMELGGGNAFASGAHRWELKPDEENMKLLRTAFEQGVNSFDTAEIYGAGHSEWVVGKALKDIRKDCIIATKVSPHHLRPNDIRMALSQSMFRLDTDYIDLYYIHAPSKDIPIAETMDELNKLKKEGIIRAIGVSNFSLEQLKEAMAYGQIDAIQPEYNLLQRKIEQDLMGFCRENSVSIMSYNSIAKGILTGVFHHGKQVNDFRKERPLFQPESLQITRELIDAMQVIADAKGAALAQIAIHWLFHQPGFTSAIIGTQNEKHFLDNVKAVEIQLSQDEVTQLDLISKKVLEKLG